MRLSIAFTIIFCTFCSITFSQELLRPSGKFLADDTGKVRPGKVDCVGAFNSGAFLYKSIKKTFWDDVNSERSSLLSFASDTTGSIYSELIVDKIGLWRISLSGAVSSAGSDTVQTAQAFFETGGNAIIKASYPLFVVYANDHKLAKYRNVGFYFVTKFGANLPALGGYSTEFSGSIDSGIEMHAYMSTDEQKITGYLAGRAALVTGTKDFRSEWPSEHKNIFGYLKASAGVIFNDRIRVGINFPVLILEKKDQLNSLPISISTGIIF